MSIGPIVPYLSVEDPSPDVSVQSFFVGSGSVSPGDAVTFYTTAGIPEGLSLVVKAESGSPVIGIAQGAQSASGSVGVLVGGYAARASCSGSVTAGAFLIAGATAGQLKPIAASDVVQPCGVALGSVSGGYAPVWVSSLLS
jgi:hypothetical protein